MATVVERDQWAYEAGGEAGQWEGGAAGISVIIHHSEGAGKGPRLHTHPYPETFIVEEGRARFTVGEETIDAGPGQILVVPADTPHRFESLGEGVMHSVHIHASGRFVTEWLE